MVQLYAYEGNTRWELDLYESDPIKINLQIEDIIEIDQIESAYSQTFRIPGTNTNSKFFKWWYEMSAIDFDITKVVRGEVHSDGLLYMTGELRLQGAYVNKETGNIDLEIIFLGNTRDFATQIAEIYMNQLDLSQYNHPLTIRDAETLIDGTLENSWKPIGSGALANGAVRYILADRGLEFDEDGGISNNLSELVAPQSNHTRSCLDNNTQWPFQPQQFTPIVQIKAIIDSIFDLTEYSYTDDSFFSDTSIYWGMVQNLYTDGLPNESATINYLDGNINVVAPFNNAATGTETKLEFTNEIVNPSDAWRQTSSEYVVQIDDVIDFNIVVEGNFSVEQGTAIGNIKLWKNGSVILTANQSISGPPQATQTVTLTYNQANVSVLQGDRYWITYEFGGSTEYASIEGQWIVSQATSIVTVGQLLKDDVLIIDFLKDILKKFRLVMAPSKIDPYKFVIKPWNDYIGTGDTLDWTYKLDHSKDVVITPIFFDQSQDILFTDTEDSDNPNTYYQDANNLIFGEYLYDGQNELISGRRDITTGFAPTPVNQVEELPSSSNFIVPKFYIHGDEQNADSAHYHLQHLPMRPKPRLLFWNGLININNGNKWYYGTTTQNKFERFNYPRASYASEIPNTVNTLHLNWNKIDYFKPIINTIQGSSVYQYYWEDYILSLYSKDARKFTSYFTLDSQDLRNFSFDDLILVEGNYYRVAKIYDAPLDNISSIKVDLIKILN